MTYETIQLVTKESTSWVSPFQEEMITSWKEIWMCSVRYRRCPWPLQSVPHSPPQPETWSLWICLKEHLVPTDQWKPENRRPSLSVSKFKSFSILSVLYRWHSYKEEYVKDYRKSSSSPRVGTSVAGYLRRAMTLSTQLTQERKTHFEFIQGDQRHG